MENMRASPLNVDEGIPDMASLPRGRMTEREEVELATQVCDELRKQPSNTFTDLVFKKVMETTDEDESEAEEEEDDAAKVSRKEAAHDRQHRELDEKREKFVHLLSQKMKATFTREWEMMHLEYKGTPLPFFSASEDDNWDAFREEFEGLKVLKMEDDEEKKRVLRLCLVGEAAKMTEKLRWDNRHFELVHILNRCGDILKPQEKTALNYFYQGVKQKIGETMVLYHYRKADAFGIAFPDKIQEQNGRDCRLTRDFIKGIWDPLVREALYHKEPMDFMAALAIAQDLAALQAEGRKKLRDIRKKYFAEKDRGYLGDYDIGEAAYRREREFFWEHEAERRGFVKDNEQILSEDLASLRIQPAEMGDPIPPEILNEPMDDVHAAIVIKILGHTDPVDSVTRKAAKLAWVKEHEAKREERKRGFQVDKNEVARFMDDALSKGSCNIGDGLLVGGPRWKEWQGKQQRIQRMRKKLYPDGNDPKEKEKPSAIAAAIPDHYLEGFHNRMCRAEMLSQKAPAWFRKWKRSQLKPLNPEAPYRAPTKEEQDKSCLPMATGWEGKTADTTTAEKAIAELARRAISSIDAELARRGQIAENQDRPESPDRHSRTGRRRRWNPSTLALSRLTSERWSGPIFASILDSKRYPFATFLLR